MLVMVTAGNTMSPIDRVRCITNVFTGRTGTSLAEEGLRRGHRVILATSHPELIQPVPDLTILPYRTFHDLRIAMARELTSQPVSALIHAAAINDYELAGAYGIVDGGRFDAASGAWSPGATLIDVARGKLSSAHPELWLRLVPTPKLVDMVREPWGFRGTLVKFKLEVDRDDEELCRISARSRSQSDADMIVANTLDGYRSHAFIGDRHDHFERVERSQLPARLWDRIESH